MLIEKNSMDQHGEKAIITITREKWQIFHENIVFTILLAQQAKRSVYAGSG
jgi:hypothetical protein